MTTSSLKPFFEPKGVAIIGASASPEKLSHGILQNMLGNGYRGSVFPINPKFDEILGLTCFSDVNKVPDPVDLAVIVLPSGVIPNVLKECAKRKIKAVIVISGGFKEVGTEGQELEKSLLKIAATNKIRLIGPNCVGNMNLRNGLNTTFIKGIPSVGGIGFISQSGAICGGVVDHIVNSGIGFSHFLSLGNEADVNETDMIEYLGGDSDTRVISAYIEGIQDGQRFIEVTRKVTINKPVVVLKAGRSEAGAKAVSSHTGSLAGSYASFQAAFKQSGVIEVSSTTDLLNTSMALDWLAPPHGNKIAIVTNSGGPAALASDNLSQYGLELAAFAPETIKKLKEKLNHSAQTENPVDMLGGANEIEYLYAMKQVLNDPGVDMVLPILVPTSLVSPDEVAMAIVKSAKESGKPIIACLMGSESIKGARKILHQNHIPMVDFPELTGVMFGALYKRFLDSRIIHKEKTDFKNSGKNRVTQLLKKREDIKVWGEHATRPILKAYGIPMIEGFLSNTIADGILEAKGLGYPVVMKIASDQILHKSEAGVVKTGISDEKMFSTTFKNLIEKAKKFDSESIIEGILIEKMAPKGEEVIIGMKRDPSFGPMMMFGLGGIFVELFKDVSFRIAPLNEKDAIDMIMETKAFKLLDGWRGGSRFDIKSIADVINRLSQIAIDFPEIEEIEINPLIVYPKGEGVIGVDCRMILK